MIKKSLGIENRGTFLEHLFDFCGLVWYDRANHKI